MFVLFRRLSLTLARERVALQPLGGTGYRIWFRDLDLGTVDLPPPNEIIDAVARAHLDQPLKRSSKNKRTKEAA